MKIIVTEDDNQEPSFDASEYEVSVTSDSNQIIWDLRPYAFDPDMHSFGNGEITFSRWNETDVYNNETGIYST